MANPPNLPPFSSSTPEFDTFFRPFVIEDPGCSIPDSETDVPPAGNANGFAGNANGSAGNANGSNPPASVENLLAAPGRETLKYLHPKVQRGAIWFKRDPYGVITKSILRMQKTDVNHAFLTYRSLPADTKERWFKAFAQEFNWDPSITKIVERGFEKQAAYSFSKNLSEWKDKWKCNKEKPIHMSGDLWKEYIQLWRDEKVAGLAATNSQNRRSNPDGEGIPVHFNGAKSFYRRKDEMTIENGGVEPNMLAFIEDVYKSKKTGKIVYKKAKRIVETLKEQVNDLQSEETHEDGPVQSKELSCSEINDLVRKAIPKKKGHRFGFGSLLDHEELNTPFLPTLDNDKKLEEAYTQISELVKEKEENTKTIQYLKDVTEKLLNKFPDCRPPEDEDDDETQD